MKIKCPKCDSLLNVKEETFQEKMEVVIGCPKCQTKIRVKKPIEPVKKVFPQPEAIPPTKDISPAKVLPPTNDIPKPIPPIQNKPLSEELERKKVVAKEELDNRVWWYRQTRKIPIIGYISTAIYIGYSLNKLKTQIDANKSNPSRAIKSPGELNLVLTAEASSIFDSSIGNEILEETSIPRFIYSPIRKNAIKKLVSYMLAKALSNNTVLNTIAATNQQTKSENEVIAKPIDIRSLFITYKFQLLVSLTALFILFPILSSYVTYSFLSLLIGLIFFSIVPILLLKSLNFTKTYKLFFALPIFYLVCFIGRSQYSGFGQQSPFYYNYTDSLRSASVWFNYIFYLSVLIVFVVEIIEQKKKELLPVSIDKYKFIFSPIVPLAALFIPLISLFSYYTVTRHQITDEEAKDFESTNSYFSGDWYFMNTDSTDMFKFQVFPVSSHQRYNTGELTAKFEYKIFKMNQEYKGGEAIDTIIKYDTKLELPLKFKSGTEISSLNDSLLNIKLKFSNGNSLFFKAIKNKNNLVTIIDERQRKKSDERIKQFQVTEVLTLISGYIREDYSNFQFKNAKGEDVIFSQLPVNVVEYFDAGDDRTEVLEKYLNKKYKIVYEEKMVHHESNNSDNIEKVISEMSIVDKTEDNGTIKEPKGTWVVLLGSFKSVDNAQALIKKCKGNNIDVTLLNTNDFEKLNKDCYCVCGGKQLSENDAKELAKNIKSKNIDAFAKDAGSYNGND